MTTPRERRLRSILPVLAAALLAPLPHAAQAQGRAPSEAAPSSSSSALAPVRGAIASRAGELRAFYAARGDSPLWLNEFGRPSGAAAMLMDLLRTANFDGVDARGLPFERLVRLLDAARRGGIEQGAEAEVELSRAFAAYVRSMRAARQQAAMIYESEALAPVVPTAQAALEAAGAAASLEHYVAEMRWMHPLYAPLREAMTDPRFTESQRRQMWTNLARVRAIPAIPRGRHILVDTVSARLWMYEDGRVVDTMKVVVGKPELQTPMMAGFVRYAILNPYWNVPEDLVRTNIAANVLDQGLGYLSGGGYQVLADWSAAPRVLDPEMFDWRAIREGRATPPRVRQLPGGENFMGKVKFMFPNDQGIYLHDTPDKHLLRLDARQLSSGCVRLEDAGRLHRWLTGAPLPAQVGEAEKFEPLPEMVPIYITHLTAMPEGGQIAFRADPYGRDSAVLLAQNSRGTRADRP